MEQVNAKLGHAAVTRTAFSSSPVNDDRPKRQHSPTDSDDCCVLSIASAKPAKTRWSI